MFLNLNLFFFLVGMAGIIIRGTEASKVVMVRLQNQDDDMCLTWLNHVPGLWNECAHSNKLWKLLVYDNGVMFQMNNDGNQQCLRATNPVDGSGFDLRHHCDANDKRMIFRWTLDGKIRFSHYYDLCIGMQGGNAEDTGLKVEKCTLPDGVTGNNLKWIDPDGKYVGNYVLPVIAPPSPTVTPPIASIPSVPGTEEEVIMVTLQNQEDDKMCLHWSAVPGLYSDCDHSNKEWGLLRYSDDSR
jgi:hypothetical protein